MSDEQNNDEPQDDDLQSAMQAAFGEEATEWLEEEAKSSPGLGDDFDFASLANALVNPSEQLDLEGSNAPGGTNLTQLLQTISTTLQEPELGGENVSVTTETESVEQGVRHVVFEAGGQQFGLPLPGVREIDRCTQVTALPRTPRWLRGVTNLRGDILSVTDFSELLSLSSDKVAHAEKIIVVMSEKHNARTALVVDKVLGIRPLHAEEIPVDGTSEEVTKFANGIAVRSGDEEDALRPIILIDPDQLLGCDELAAFSADQA